MQVTRTCFCFIVCTGIVFDYLKLICQKEKLRWVENIPRAFVEHLCGILKIDVRIQ